MSPGPKIIEFFHTADGRCPFEEWFSNLNDLRARGKIQSRLVMLRAGNPGKIRNLAGGITEAKIDYGPGYRYYYGEKDGKYVILLCGGNKSTQTEDINRAREFWGRTKGEKWRNFVRALTRGLLRI